MGKGYYDIYCDESAIDGGGSFYFGGLYCTSIRADKLRKQLKEVRLKHQCTGEMKWTKVSAKMLPVYTDFVDVFINDPHSRFYVLEVRRDINWRTWAPTEEERFFKAYYVFLRRLMSGFSRYGVYLDYKNGKWYRWSSLQFAMNNKVKESYYPKGQKQVHTLKAVNSKNDDLLQLVDVLLGAKTSTATAVAKVQLAQYVREKLSEQITSFVVNPEYMKKNQKKRRQRHNNPSAAD